MQSILLIGIPSGMEWAIILVMIVMLFGLGKLPTVAKQMGAGMRDFKKSLNGDDEDEEEEEEVAVAARKELESEESVKAPKSKKSRVASS